MSNSVDPDETAHDHDEPSHLDLRCLQKPIIIACGCERVKSYNISSRDGELLYRLHIKYMFDIASLRLLL